MSDVTAPREGDAIREHVAEATRAVVCLRLEVPEAVADDVQRICAAVFRDVDALLAVLAEAEREIERLRAERDDVHATVERSAVRILELSDERERLREALKYTQQQVVHYLNNRDGWPPSEALLLDVKGTMVRIENSVTDALAAPRATTEEGK